MRSEYLYIIVRADGVCRRHGDPSALAVDLTQLLAEGWVPVRETSFGDGAILVLLEWVPEEIFDIGCEPE